MTFEELQLLISEDYGKAVEAITKERDDADKIQELLKQYDVAQHDILNKDKRPDKPIENDKGETVRYEEVNRLGLAMQELIAGRAAAFLCANPIDLQASATDKVQQDLLSIVLKTWDDNKCDFRNLDMAEKMMAETEVAELWYTEKLEPGDPHWEGTVNKGRPWRLRMLVLANSLGDKLYPVKDPTGNMIAFGRAYKLRVGGRDEEHFDLYTDKIIYKGVKQEGGAYMETREVNGVGKIPVIYYSQPRVEWYNVQNLIERLEKKLSNHGDTNDYFDSPILYLEGQVESMTAKGDSGKVIVGKKGTKASYVSWDHSVDSTKLEVENLVKFIHTISQTPDISFEAVKGLGEFSGIALKMLFMDAHLKAAKKGGIFGEGIQRRINFLKAANARINVTLEKGRALSIKPKFDFFLPKDDAGEVDTLVQATQGGIMSRQTAVRLNPKVENPEAELELIEGEKPTEEEKLKEVLDEE